MKIKGNRGTINLWTPFQTKGSGMDTPKPSIRLLWLKFQTNLAWKNLRPVVAQNS